MRAVEAPGAVERSGREPALDDRTTLVDMTLLPGSSDRGSKDNESSVPDRRAVGADAHRPWRPLRPTLARDTAVPRRRRAPSSQVGDRAPLALDLCEPGGERASIRRTRSGSCAARSLLSVGSRCRSNSCDGATAPVASGSGSRMISG